MVFSLHLDQKKASYGTNHMHSGEYEGPTIEKEMLRIDRWVNHVEPEQSSDGVTSSFSSQKPWWKIW